LTILKKGVEYLLNLWYSIFRIDKVNGVEIMKKKVTIFVITTNTF